METTSGGAGIAVLFIAFVLLLAAGLALMTLVGELPALGAINVPSQAAVEREAVTSMVLPGTGEVVLSDHATERHGWEAVQARELARHSVPGNRFECNDGRTRYIVPDGEGGWGIVVLEGLKEITAFVSPDPVYVARQALRCGATPSVLERLGLRLVH